MSWLAARMAESSSKIAVSGLLHTWAVVLCAWVMQASDIRSLAGAAILPTSTCILAFLYPEDRAMAEEAEKIQYPAFSGLVVNRKE